MDDKVLIDSFPCHEIFDRSFRDCINKLAVEPI